MPKNKSGKRRKGRSHGLEAATNGSDHGTDRSHDDARSEDSSVLSVCSDPPSDRSLDSHGIDEEPEENFSADDREAKVKDAIDGLSEKSVKYRHECLKTITKHFLSSDMSEILESYRDTLSSALEKCIRKGKSEEQCLAAILVAAVSIQIGTIEGSEEIFNNFKSVLVPVMLDKSASVRARAKCCEALGVYCFVAAAEMSDVIECMKKLETIFQNSYFKGDGNLPSVSPEVCELHNSALLAWGLLLSVCDWSSADVLVKSSLPKMLALLQSSDVDLRITAGETIALFYEILYNEDELDTVSGNIDEVELCECLRSLATDSNKHRAKKDRRQQRSSFRDVLKTVEDGVAPEDQIKFGKEVLRILSWTQKRQYEAFRSILGTGVNFHLKCNDLLRDVFELGPSVTDTVGSKGSKSSHFERHLHNQAMSKARTKVRGKLRDKRTGFRT